MKLINERIDCPTCDSGDTYPEEPNIKDSIVEVRFECHDCAEIFDFRVNLSFGSNMITSTPVGLNVALEELNREAARIELRDRLDAIVRRAFPDDRFSVVLKECSRD